MKTIALAGGAFMQPRTVWNGRYFGFFATDFSTGATTEGLYYMAVSADGLVVVPFRRISRQSGFPNVLPFNTSVVWDGKDWVLLMQIGDDEMGFGRIDEAGNAVAWRTFKVPMGSEFQGMIQNEHSFVAVFKDKPGLKVQVAVLDRGGILRGPFGTLAIRRVLNANSALGFAWTGSELAMAWTDGTNINLAFTTEAGMELRRLVIEAESLAMRGMFVSEGGFVLWGSDPQAEHEVFRLSETGRIVARTRLPDPKFRIVGPILGQQEPTFVLHNGLPRGSTAIGAWSSTGFVQSPPMEALYAESIEDVSSIGVVAGAEGVVVGLARAQGKGQMLALFTCR